MRSKRGLALIITGVVLLLGAAGLTAYNIHESSRAEQTAAEGLSAVAEEIEAARSRAQNTGTSSISAQTQFAEETKELGTVQANGRTYVGIVEIPALGITLPVLSEWSYANLKIAPCLYAGSPYTNDLILCAHNYRSHFNGLRTVEMGADVYFTTVDGKTFHFVIANRETLQPDENDRLLKQDGSWQLTLFTCYVGGATRCVIRCELAD